MHPEHVDGQTDIVPPGAEPGMNDSQLHCRDHGRRRDGSDRSLVLAREGGGESTGRLTLKAQGETRLGRPRPAG